MIQLYNEEDLPRISVAQSAVNSILTQLPNLLSPPQETQQAPVPVIPTISVSAVNSNITEGEVAEFNLVTSNYLTSNLRVSFKLNQRG